MNNNTILTANDNNALHQAQQSIAANAAKLKNFAGLKSVPGVIMDKIQQWDGMDVSELHQSIMDYLAEKKGAVKAGWNAESIKVVESSIGIIDNALTTIGYISRKVWDFCKGLGSSAKTAFLKYSKIFKDTFASLLANALKLLGKAGSAVVYIGSFAFKVVANVGKTIFRFLSYIKDKIKGKISDMVDDWEDDLDDFELDDPDVANAVDGMMVNMSRFNS